jgi:hypothetical protein
MKLFLTDSISVNAKAKDTLDTLGIDNTTSETASGVTNFFVTKIPEITNINSIAELQNLVGTYKLNTSEWLLNKFGIQGSHKLNDKLELNNTLTALGMPSIPTLYPTSQAEIDSFFATHGTVFCKPRLGFGASEPSLDISKIIPNKFLSNIDSEQSAAYLATIDKPTSTTHFYKSYTSAATLSTDADNLLDVQNSETSILPHQCILQKDFSNGTGAWKLIHVTGFINGSGDVIHEPYMIRDTVWTNTPEEFDTGFNGSTPINTTRNKLWFDYDTMTEAQIAAVVDSRIIQGSDSYDVAGKLKQIFNHAGVKNTVFTAQGYVNDDNEIVFFDFSTSGAAQIFKRTWISNETMLNRLKFMSDETYDATKVQDTTKRFWFHAGITNGLTSELAAQAASSNIIFTYPVKSGWKLVSCTAYGDNSATIAANVKAFLAACKA